MQAESQRIQKTAQDQEVGLKEPVAPRTRRAKDGMGGTARRARSFPALFPKNLCPVDEALEQRRGAIKIDGDVQDEAVRVFHPPEQIRNVEQSTLRGGPFSMTFKSYNPPAMARNWANRYALEDKPGKLVHHSTYLTTPPEWLGPRFLADAEHLKATNPTAYRHEYLGEVVGSGTQVFANLQLRDIPGEEISQFDRITNGVDWGWYPDPWAWNRMHYDAARRTLYLFSELTRHRTSNQDTAALLMERIPQDELVIADSAEEKSVSDYKAFGLNCRASEKGPGSVAYSMKWLQSLSAIVIDPSRCPDTAREFGEYEYERDPKTGEVLEGYPDVANHHIDAVRYGTNRIWKRRGK